MAPIDWHAIGFTGRDTAEPAKSIFGDFFGGFEALLELGSECALNFGLEAFERHLTSGLEVGEVDHIALAEGRIAIDVPEEHERGAVFHDTPLIECKELESTLS